MRQIARAQVHATLALAAAVVAGAPGLHPETRAGWELAIAALGGATGEGQ